MRKPATYLLLMILPALSFREEQNIRVFRTAVIDNPPFESVVVGPNGTRNYIGAGKNVFEWLSSKLCVTIEFVYPSQELVKSKSVEASLDLVVHGEADITSTGFVPTPERVHNAEITTFLAWEEGYRMIAPRPGEQHRLFAFVRPFQLSVWLLSLASTVIATIGMGCFAWLYGRFPNYRPKKNKKTSMFAHFGNYFTYNISVLTNHGEYLTESRVTSFLILASFWLIGASVLVYGYSSTVVSSLTLPRTKPAVSSLEDVLISNDVSLLLRVDMYAGMLIMNLSEAPLHKALKEKMQSNPEALVNDYYRVGKLLKTKKYASPQLDSFSQFYIGSEYRKERKCDFKLSSRMQSISNSYFYFFLQKGNKILAHVISLRMMELWETGLSRFWIKNSLLKADECFAPETYRLLAKQTSIKLVDLTSAFFILGVGLSISVSIFLCEFFSHFSSIPKKTTVINVR